MRRFVIAVALLLIVQVSARAQSIRGVVVDATDRPVSGVVLLLIDATSHEAGRTLSNEQGEFRLAAPAAGSYRVRTLRIGFRPVTSDPLDLSGDDLSVHRFVLTGTQVTLDTVRTGGKNACRVVAKDSAALTFGLWEQVRTALTATLVTASSHTILATTVGYDRTLDPNMTRVHAQSMDVRTDYVKQPWRSLSPDSLRKVGYVTTERNDMRLYYAPGFDVLLSQSFLEDHCLHLASTKDTSRIGIAFEPTSDRKNFAEIRGTLWLDRKSSELRAMDFRYENVTREEQNRSGGEMEFVRMRNGMWAISRWNIRMPTIVLVPVYANTKSAGLTQTGQDTRVDSIKVTGGELVVAAVTSGHNRDTVWMRPRLILAGTVVDSVSGRPIAGATVGVGGTILKGASDAAGRFSIPDLLPGRYMLEVRTPSLDSVNAASQSSLLFTDSAAAIKLKVPTAAQIAGSLCGNSHIVDPKSSDGGILMGDVTVPGDTIPPKGAKVVATWNEISIRNNIVANEPRMSDTRTDAHGTFRICGVPVNTALMLQATTDSASSGTTGVRIAPDRRFANVALELSRSMATGGTLIGVVMTDSTRVPLADADVSLPELTMSVRTDDKGAFRLSGIPTGSQHVIVRHVGFGAVDTHIDFAKNETVNRQVVLNRIAVLDSVTTTAPSLRDAWRRDFDDNKRLGLGHFWTREDLAKNEGAFLSTFMRQTQGLTLIQGASNEDWVGSSLPARTGCGTVATARLVSCLEQERLYYVPTAAEMRAGAQIACLARVYLDDQLLNPGDPAGPVDLRDYPPSMVEALEFYATPAQTPQKYQRKTNATCGVLVIHTRRP